MHVNPKIRSGLFPVLVSAVPFSVCAGTLECEGTIISPGATEAQLLEACGNPDSRNGADWIYTAEGSLPTVVTLGDGVVMLIRDANETDLPSSPLGDTP